jgi:hypothetical protein
LVVFMVNHDRGMVVFNEKPHFPQYPCGFSLFFALVVLSELMKSGGTYAAN